MESSPAGLLRRFGLLIVVVGASGAVLAFVADRPSVGPNDAYWDALREVGGAIVSGAILAGLVVWFEDRRDDERVERENQRDDARFEREEDREDAAARRAWRRDLDIRLVSVVRTDLMAGRLDVLQDFDEDTRPRSIGRLIADSSIPPRGRSFGQSFDEVDSLLEFLRDEGLTNAWQSWSDAYDHLADVPEPAIRPSAGVGSFDGLGGLGDLPSRRDVHKHAVALAAETSAWVAFLAAVNQYVESNYPVD